jgi:hypothetical protein
MPTLTNIVSYDALELIERLLKPRPALSLSHASTGSIASANGKRKASADARATFEKNKVWLER